MSKSGPDFLIMANTLWLNLLLLALIILLVILMPAIDHKICQKLDISPNHRPSKSPRAEQLLTYRQIVLYIIFILYAAANIYLAFYNRQIRATYKIHIAPFKDIRSSVAINYGLDEFLWLVFTGQMDKALTAFKVVRGDYIGQVVANILFYIPLGYLLPYVFKWFRKNYHRTIITCFCCSFLTENFQLIFRRGTYDFDDMVTNTIGGLIGLLFFRSFAYYITNPDWKKKVERKRNYRKRAKSTVLAPISRNLTCGRVTMLASSEDDIYHFFVEILGFHLVGQHVDLESDATSLLLELGGIQIEFLCSNRQEPIPAQTIMLSASYLNKVKKRLQAHQITPSEYEPDLYTRHTSMYITGPDNIRIIFEEY